MRDFWQVAGLARCCFVCVHNHQGLAGTEDHIAITRLVLSYLPQVMDDVQQHSPFSHPSSGLFPDWSWTLEALRPLHQSMAALDIRFDRVCP